MEFLSPGLSCLAPLDTLKWAFKGGIYLCLWPYAICSKISCPGRNVCRASDFFQDWWAEVTHGAKNGGSFSEMMGPSISH